MKLAAALAICAAVASGAAPETLTSSYGAKPSWVKIFASPKTDWINDVAQLRDGNLMAVGYLGRDDQDAAQSNWQALAVKLTPGGRELWRRVIDNPGKLDAFWAIRERPDGVLVLTGMTDGFGKGTDAYLVQLSRRGNVLVQQGYGGAGDDRATDLALTPDGGAVLFGQTDSSGAGERDIMVVRTDRNGQEVWRKTYGGAGLDRGFYGAAVKDGFIVAGITGVEGDVDVVVQRISGTGETVWRTVVGEPNSNDTQHGLALLPNGHILVTGYTQSWGAVDRDMMAITLAADGEVLHRQAFGGAGDDRIMSVKAAPDGAWAAGYTKSTSSGEWDAFITRLDAQGRFTGEVETFGTGADDRGTSALALDNGDVIVSGYSASLGEGGLNGFVMRVTPGKKPNQNFIRRSAPQ